MSLALAAAATLLFTIVLTIAGVGAAFVLIPTFIALGAAFFAISNSKAGEAENDEEGGR